MIENFTPQPYPLWVAWWSPPEEYTVDRVLGWTTAEDPEGTRKLIPVVDSYAFAEAPDRAEALWSIYDDEDSARVAVEDRQEWVKHQRRKYERNPA